MVFAAPWMLLGLAGLGVPIALHLLDRSRSEPVDWPSLRFLRIARQQTARRSRLKHLLVLIARCLLLALLVLAMAQPYTQEKGFAKPPDLPTTLAIVLDTSYSMRYELPGADGTRFDRAKELAAAQLSDLSLKDEVGLVLASDTARPVSDRPTRNRRSIRRRIEQAAASNRGTALGPALSTAFSMANRDAPLESESDDNAEETPSKKRGRRDAWRHVLVITDMQASGWSSVIDGDLMESVDRPLPVTVLDVGGDETANRFVREVEMQRTRSAGRLAVQASVATRGDVPGGRATLWIDDEQVGSPRMVDTTAGTVRLAADMPPAGFHRCRVELESDQLPIDDRRHFALNVGAGSRLTVVNGDPAGAPRLSETYFLKTALNLRPGSSESLDVQHIAPDELAGATLGGSGAVVLANVPRLGGSALTKLESFLRAGGNVFVALGDRVDVQHYNDAWPFMPIRLTERMEPPSGTAAASLRVEQTDHPMLAELQIDPARFFAMIGADGRDLRHKGRVLASFSNGAPAFVEGRYGGRQGGDTTGGRVVVMTSAIDDDWSNLPYRRVYVPLIDRIVTYLTRQPLRWRSVRVGRPVRFTGPASLRGSTVRISPPGGEAKTLSAVVEPDSDEASVEFRETESVGVYRVEGPAEMTGAGGFAVNLDTAESVLRRVDPPVLREAFGDRPLRIVSQQPQNLTEWAEPERRREEGRLEYWPWLLLAALMVFAAETLLANLFTRRRSAAPPPTTEYMGTRRTEGAMLGASGRG